MKTPKILLKFVAKAVLNAVGGGIAGDAVVDVLPEVAREVWEWWGRRKPAEQRAELEALAQAPQAEVREAVAEVVAEVAPVQPADVSLALESYLGQVPAALRQSLRRPSDPTGRTAPHEFRLLRPDDLLTILPAKLPRFKPGDRPLPGVDWELVELLGTGGFGEVWKARNPHFDGVPPVALKFCLDPAAKDRLLRHEAAVLNQVMRQGRHAGIVTLLHTYLSADPPCLEYEYVAGGELAGVIQDYREKGGLSPVLAAQVTRKLAGIVGFAHHLTPPVVHRDLKPANVLVQRRADGKFSFRVADFGIGGVAAGQAIQQSRKATSRGELLASSMRGSCTPLYASPQQMRGDAPDPRDDVYSLGVIWHQLLTGDLGSGAPTGRVWRARLAEKGMAQELIDLLERCFEDRPADRPADAGKLAEEVARLLPPPQRPDKTTGVEKPAVEAPVGKVPVPESPTHSGKSDHTRASESEAPTLTVPCSRSGSLADAPGQPSAPGPVSTSQQVTEDKNPALAHLRRGKDYADKGEHEQAIAALTEAIRLDPKLALAYAYRGDAQGDLEKYDEGIADCDEAIRLDPKLGLAYAYRGWIYSHKRWRQGKAVADCDEAVRLSPEEAEVYRIRGDVHSSAEEYDRAIADFTEAIRLDPRSALAYAGRGAAYHSKEEYDWAITDLTEAIRLDPTDQAAHFDRGMAHSEKGDYDPAIADFTEAIRQDPKAARAYHARGWAYSKKEDYERAIADYTEAIGIENEAEFYQDRGLAYYCQGNAGKAIADYKRAIKIDPADAMSYDGRGWAYELKGDYDKAVDDFTEAIKVDAEFAEAYFGRAEMHSACNRHGRAVGDYSKAIEINQQFSDAYYGRARAHSARGEYDKAEADYSECIRIDPGTASAYAGRGWSCYHRREYDRAITDFAAAIKLDAEYVDAYKGRGAAYHMKDEYDQAITDCAEAIRLAPDDPLAYCVRGQAYSKQGEWIRAVEDYTEAIRLDGKFADAYFERGVAYDAQGRHEEAIADYDKAIRHNRKHALAYYRRSLALREKGEEARAEEDYKKAVELDPGVRNSADKTHKLAEKSRGSESLPDVAGPDSEEPPPGCPDNPDEFAPVTGAFDRNDVAHWRAVAEATKTRPLTETKIARSVGLSPYQVSCVIDAIRKKDPGAVLERTTKRKAPGERLVFQVIRLPLEAEPSKSPLDRPKKKGQVICLGVHAAVAEATRDALLSIPDIARKTGLSVTAVGELVIDATNAGMVEKIFQDGMSRYRVHPPEEGTEDNSAEER